MLSRRTWAGLAAGAGLGFFLAGLSIAGWWFLDARYQPVQVDPAETIETLLQGAPAVELYAGQRPVYVIGPRGDDIWEHWALKEASRLSAVGRGVRALVVPSAYGGAAEEVTLAQLWLNADGRLLQQWLERNADLWTGAGLPSLRSDPLRQEALTKATEFARVLGQETGASGRWPLVFWHDPAGALVLCVCDTPQAQARARKILGLTAQAETGAPKRERAESGPVAEVKPVSMPYPQGQPLPATVLSIEALNEPVSDIAPSIASSPSPRLPGDVVLETQQTVATQTVRPIAPVAPVSRSRARVVNRAPPEAKKEAESLFF